MAADPKQNLFKQKSSAPIPYKAWAGFPEH